jgi:hypothetical protein
MEANSAAADARSVLRLLATVVGASLLLAGCSSAEGQRAQTLLQQAEAAQAGLSSSTFEGGMTFAYEGEQVAMRFRGATSKEGEWFSLRADDLPGAGDMSLQVVSRGGRIWTNFGGGWQSSQAPATGAGAGTMSAAAFQQLARYVKDVRVNEHQLVAGELVTTIGGEIDTQGMVEALTKLAPFASGEGFDLSELGVDFGDIHAVLTLDERTHLLTAALITFEVTAKGESVTFDLRYRLTSSDEPVELPSPSG